MLDPKEQAKGGFRAQVERRRERDEQIAAEAHGTSDAPGSPATPPEQQADGAPDVSPPPTAEPTPPTPGTRQPKRWH